MSGLTLVELFAGIGGFSCGFSRAGVRTVAAVEIDQAARRIFAKNFPEVKLFDDVTKVTADDLMATGFIPERGIITAGWPCQDISRAGLQTGICGERSGLFFEVTRILESIKPRWFVLENVPRLLSINSGGDMGAVIGSLVECGYGVCYRVLDSCNFGVAQKRRRIFFVGLLGDTGERSGEILLDPSCLRGAVDKNSEAGPQHRALPKVLDGASGPEWCADRISTLQGGGKRGYRIDAEGVAGGHLIVSRRYGGQEINPK